jgi:uncharacterized repeat protein (TIGR03943 family)
VTGHDHAPGDQHPALDLHGVVLLLAGGALLRIAWTGSYTSYVKVGARPYLYLAGAVITVLALISLGQAIASRRRTYATGGDHGHPHHGRFDVAWLLVVPLAVLLLIAPKPAGAYEAGRAGSALPPAPSSYAALPAGDPVALSVVDYVSRAVYDSGHTLTGRHLQLTGFLTAAPGGGWFLTRMLVTCCAADAQPIKLGLTGPLPAGVRTDAWLTVVGTYTTQTTKDTVNAATIPFLAVTSAHLVTQPADPYES